MNIRYLFILGLLHNCSPSPLAPLLGDAFWEEPGLVEEVAFNEEQMALEVIRDQENKVQSLPMLLNKKITDRELQAITEQNCSVAYLTFHDEKEMEIPNAEAACVVALWFQGNYPAWMETEDLVQEMTDADEVQIKDFADQVCPCGVIDIDAECPEDVLNAMDLIKTQCQMPDDTNLIRFWSQTNNGIIEVEKITNREEMNRIIN